MNTPVDVFISYAATAEDEPLCQQLERNTEGAAKVIPIIIRPLDLSPAPFKGLSVLPADGEAVTKWSNAALLMLAGVVLSSALGSRDEGCRAPVPETRRVDRLVAGGLSTVRSCRWTTT